MDRLSSSPIFLAEAGVSRLEPEPQEGPTEYKLHLLLRPRRNFLSSSTGSHVSGSQHPRPYLAASGSRIGSNVTPTRPTPAPSSQTRQARLQHLTTQLLWRLQQSSPFHSSSTANLVLPVLPEATPRLNAPADAAKLLPGLEESQGALYEIGVSDDGTFVGLIEEEMEESLTNLKAMAASLGCVVDVLRKVIVGDCEWTEAPSGEEQADWKTHKDTLWVAEALVRPNLDASAEATRVASSRRLDEHGQSTNDADTTTEITQSKTEQLRISLTGSSASGKSSLLGTLTTSTLDNGRGKSRLSLLRHRHEIASGVTSSVAQELIGYRFSPRTEASGQAPKDSEHVINYAAGNVSSWNDMHGYADRLVFLSDSPGMARFSKSAIRTLTSWQPHWTLVCVAANEDDEGAATSSSNAFTASAYPLPTLDPGPDMTLSHLDLCMRLNLPVVVVITKMDLATKSCLRQTLAKVLSALKAKGKKPVMLSATTGPVPSAPDGPPGPQCHEGEEFNIDLQHISAADEEDVLRTITIVTQDPEGIVPIVLVSAVTGAGIGKVHALLRSLPREGNIPPSLPSHGHPRESTAPLQVFHIDEVFAMPPSKVYSPAIGEHADKGIVLCGRVGCGTISVGERLVLGPFDPINGDKQVQDRSGSRTRPTTPQKLAVSAPTARTSTAEDFLRVVADTQAAKHTSETNSVFVSVRIVSLRNLRLPVRSLLPGQVGTIGIELIANENVAGTLTSVRRGMVLLDSSFRHAACRSLTGSFRSSDFAFNTSPPLILGGHAMIYVNSVRVAVKVTAVALSESEAPESPSPTEMFSFESENDQYLESNGAQDQEIKITFRFVSTVEWMQVGDKILVVPNLSAAGPVAGPSGPTSGLSGFVGRIVDVNGA
jgi:GTPase